MNQSLINTKPIPNEKPINNAKIILCWLLGFILNVGASNIPLDEFPIITSAYLRQE